MKNLQVYNLIFYCIKKILMSHYSNFRSEIIVKFPKSRYFIDVLNTLPIVWILQQYLF